MASVPSSVINEMCAKWREVTLFVENYHPDTMLGNRAVYIFSDNAHLDNSATQKKTTPIGQVLG